MPLPKINTPTYELVLPSTGKKIKYRPFLVREEKILIMAMESEDMNQITNAIIQIISDCLLNKDIKVESLATFDMEYLFLNIRAKSVGETVEVNVTALMMVKLKLRCQSILMISKLKKPEDIRILSNLMTTSR